MNKELLRLAIPNIISNISIPILSTVDTALMGLLSPLHIGAVGLASMIFNFIYWNFGFLRMGTTGITAQAFGQKDLEDVIHTLLRGVLIALGISFLLLLVQGPLLDIGIQLLNVPSQQVELVSTYFNIRIWAAPASLLMYCFLGWFFGLQNALIPLIVTVSINVVNILLSYIFIVSFEWDIAGVAWSTVIAQYVGLLLCIAFLFYKYHHYLNLKQWKELFQWSKFKHFLQINSNLFVRTVCLTFSFGYFYSQSAKLGSQLLAVNVILLQFLNWLSYAIDGFAYAAESVVGKYMGAKDIPNTNMAIRKSLIWGGGLSFLFSAIYWIFGDQIIWLFTDSENLAIQTQSYLFWMWIIPMVAFASYIWDGIFIGLTASKAMRNTMIFSLLIFIGFYEWMAPGMHTLWIAMLLFLIARGLAQTILFIQKGLHLK